MKFERIWFRLALTTGLVVLAAFCFLRYIEWAFSYSATLGLASKAQETRLASHLAWLFLFMFIAYRNFNEIGLM